MPFTLTGITTVDHLKESGLKSVWEVWREYAYKTSLVVVSLFVLAPQVRFSCVNDPKMNKDQQLTTVEANAVNSYCKTHFMPWHTRYSAVFAFAGSIILYLVSNFWIHIPGNRERLRYLGRFTSGILKHHMNLEEMEKVAAEPIESSSDKRSHSVRESVLMILNTGECRKLREWYVRRCFLLLGVLILFALLSAWIFDSWSIFSHGQDDIVTCYIPKSAIGLEDGNFTFTCIDEFTMVDSMLEFVFFVTMCAQALFVFMALRQTFCPCEEYFSCGCCFCGGRCESCSHCKCLSKRDIPDFVISMAGLDHEQASVITGFSKYVLRDAKEKSNGEVSGTSEGDPNTETNKKGNGGTSQTVSDANGKDGGEDETFKNRLLENEQKAIDVGDEVFSEILKRLSDHDRAPSNKPGNVPSSNDVASSSNQNEGFEAIADTIC